MGQHNYIDVPWVCPVCKTLQADLIQFSYGVLDGTYYQIGDRINWLPIGSEKALVIDERLPHGTGTIDGAALCNNRWYYRWRSLPGNLTEKNLPSEETRRAIGCPTQIRLLIDLVDDVIVKVRSGPNSEDWCWGKY